MRQLSRATRVGAVALLAGLGWMQAGSVAAQVLPREFPPESYPGNQYVDSGGCVFIRAGVAGATRWVPRLSQSREQLCGFAPTFPEGIPLPAMADIPDDLPNLIAVPENAPAPAPAAEAGGPAATMAGRPVPTSPQVVPPPAAAPAPEAQAQRTTLAAFCEGRRGVQGGFVNAETGETIDCGGGVRPAAASPAAMPATMPGPMPAASPQPERLTLGAFCEGRSGPQPGWVNAETRETISCGPAALPAPMAGPVNASVPVAGPGGAVTVAGAEPRRVALADLCAEAALTGLRYVYRETGLPVCGTAPTTLPVAAPVPGPTMVAASQLPGGPGMPGAPAAPATAGTMTAFVHPCRDAMGAYLTGGGTGGVRCGPQAQSPSGAGAAAPAPLTTARFARASGLEDIFNPQPIPASNPVGAPIPAHPPAGYVRAWEDGRVNPQRGLPARYASPFADAGQAAAAGYRASDGYLIR
ncbi:hypothetical protein [Wenxinia saemankumensis]|uniref:Uncharacterized protein n=1 Tax=Wenxinia saemankumensis TaxID=1447782 RepID=A0A1M6CU06_9RHOB|nr:hypothetical protein [Wenxinia saemankumensis]SHI64502.1 hypothetical protein SAMN05444417_1364 [Wenxinia saemankumensis]